MEPLTPATSVTTTSGLDSVARASLASWATFRTGVAMTTRSTSGDSSVPVITPTSIADVTVAATLSTPVTIQPASLSAKATDAPIRPRPTTWAWRLFGEVITQALSVSKVDVSKIAAGPGRIEVNQNTNALRHGTRHVNLTGAKQRNITETNAARRGRRERRGQIAGRGEYDTDDVVVDQLVSIHQRAQQFLGGVFDRRGRVRVARRGDAKAS